MTDMIELTELWIASANQKKRAELERLLTPLGIRLRSLADLPEPLDIVEDRPDFAGNAEVKAVTLARHVGAPALGDDSGLCVDALDGEPGVRSARWAGPDATDSDRIDLLLHRIQARTTLARPDRDARFVCHLCLADANGNVLARIEETCEGFILDAPRGEGGFGYDPVFAPFDIPAGSTLPDGTDAETATDHRPSFAELDAAAKDQISHRGKALRQLAGRLAPGSEPPGSEPRPDHRSDPKSTL